MSDHDRGAYTPQTEEPLSFDARRPTERRPFPMTLVGCLVVLVALIGGVALVYRGGVRGAGEAPRPVGEPVMSVKTVPGPGGGDADHPSGLDLYNAPKTASAAPPVSPPSGATASGSSAPAGDQATPAQTATTTGGPFSTGPAPTFAPAPEQPTPRIVAHPPATAVASASARPASHAPAPRVAVDPPSPTTGAPDAAEVAAAGGGTRSAGAVERDRDHDRLHLASRDAGPDTLSARRRSSEAVPVGRTATDTAADEAALGRLASRSVDPEPPAETASARAPTGASTHAGGTAVVQIGAFSSAALADKGYADVAGDMSGRMAGKSKHVLALDVNGKTLYRTWLSGFASRTDAIAFCEALRARNRSCIVKG